MKTRHVLATALATVSITSVSFGHPGHDGHDLTWTLTSGAMHPLSGFDHMMAMLAIGVWAVFLGGRLRWQVLSVFAASLLAGSLGGYLFRQAAPLIEHGVVASLLTLGLLLTFAFRPPAWTSVLLSSLFGLIHGCAHGVQLPPVPTNIGYAVGLVSCSIALQMVGLLFGLTFHRHPTLARLTGIAAAGTGVVALT